MALADPSPVLVEILRESERAVDSSLRALEEFDDKAEQLLTLIVAVLGGGLVIGGYVVERSGKVPIATTALLGAAIALNLAASASCFYAYLRAPQGHVVSAGPHPRWLAERARDDALDGSEHVVAVVLAMGDAFEGNVKTVARGSRALRFGVLCLGFAILAYALSVIYLVKVTA